MGSSVKALRGSREWFMQSCRDQRIGSVVSVSPEPEQHRMTVCVRVIGDEGRDVMLASQNRFDGVKDAVQQGPGVQEKRGGVWNPERVRLPTVGGEAKERVSTSVQVEESRLRGDGQSGIGGRAPARLVAVENEAPAMRESLLFGGCQ